MTRSIAVLGGPSYYDALESSSRATPTSSPSADEVMRKYLKTSSGVKNVVFKSSAVLFEAASLYDPSTSAFKNMTKLSKDAKNLAEAATLYDSTSETSQRLWTFIANPSVETFGGLVRKTCELFVPLTDLTKVLSKHLFSLSARVMSIVEFTGSSSTVLAMSFGLNEEFGKIHAAQEEIERSKDSTKAKDVAKREECAAQITNSYITIARNLHYAALGSLSVAAMILQVLCPPVLMVSLAAGGVATTIFAHFHKEMYLVPAQEALKTRFVSVID